jgi:hypothetical protein
MGGCGLGGVCDHKILFAYHIKELKEEGGGRCTRCFIRHEGSKGQVCSKETIPMQYKHTYMHDDPLPTSFYEPAYLVQIASQTVISRSCIGQLDI